MANVVSCEGVIHKVFGLTSAYFDFETKLLFIDLMHTFIVALKSPLAGLRVS